MSITFDLTSHNEKTGAFLRVFSVIYTNYRGEVALRRFRPYDLYWGSNEWHKESQWLMDGFDEDKQAKRTFALRDIRPDTGKVRVYFKGGEYTDVPREYRQGYESQQDYDHTEEIL